MRRLALAALLVSPGPFAPRRAGRSASPRPTAGRSLDQRRVRRRCEPRELEALQERGRAARRDGGDVNARSPATTRRSRSTRRSTRRRSTARWARTCTPSRRATFRGGGRGREGLEEFARGGRASRAPRRRDAAAPTHPIRGRRPHWRATDWSARPTRPPSPIVDHPPRSAGRSPSRSAIAQTSASARSGEGPERRSKSGVSAQSWSSSFGEDAGMEHEPALVGRGDRLGAQEFSARRGHGAHRQVGLGLAQHLRHHLAAVVDLGHHPVRPEPAIGGADPRRPAGRRIALAGEVGEHVEAPVRPPCRRP